MHRDALGKNSKRLVELINWHSAHRGGAFRENDEIHVRHTFPFPSNLLLGIAQFDSYGLVGVLRRSVVPVEKLQSKLLQRIGRRATKSHIPLGASCVGSLLLLNLLTATSLGQSKPKSFDVLVQRQESKDGLLSGVISVDDKELGVCYENKAKKIPAAKFKGVIRTSSMGGHFQGPGGKMGNSGDFLLEVADVPRRTDILLHSERTSKWESISCSR